LAPKIATGIASAKALGISVRQLQRFGSGESKITPTIERLIEALQRQHSAKPKKK
jgi:hypothetical protein